MAAVLLAACDGSSPAPTSTTSASTTSRAEAATATVGVDVGFSGLVVKVGAPVDPADPAGAMVSPDPGSRYVRVPLTVRNPSSRGRSFTPAAQARLFDGQGQGYSPRPGLYEGDLAGADVAAGATVEGFLSFAVPSDSTLSSIVFTDLQGVTTTVELGG